MRVLIIGYGKMGRIHAKHLTELGVPWDYHDPHVAGGVGLESLDCCTHAIVATPIDTHYEVYRQLDGFPGRILIEKPVVTRAEHLHVLDNPRVFPGMCERFNPAVIEAQRRLGKYRSLEFVRTGPSVTVEDVAIHDLDLCCMLLEWHDVPEWQWREWQLHTRGREGMTATFRWNSSQTPERSLRISTESGGCHVDLLEPSIDGRALKRDWPIRDELEAFLGCLKIDAKASHAWLIDILKTALPPLVGTKPL